MSALISYSEPSQVDGMGAMVGRYLASNFIAFFMDLNLKSSAHVPAYLVNVGFVSRLSLAR
jgi:hypothetical protein